VIGLSGAVLQMFSHGVIAGLLFAVVGRMVYERTHTRDLNMLETSGLAKYMPFAAITFLLACFASMGFPAFSGFIAELSILMGSWKAFPLMTVFAGIGILLGVGFTLRALQKSFYPGTLVAAAAGNGGSNSDAHPHGGDYVPISAAEMAGAILLLGATLLIGLFPRLLFNLIQPAIQQDFFKRIISG
jgi:NADH-quinone oxidoreductase subunit M